MSTEPIYTPFFGVMGATAAVAFSGMYNVDFCLCCLSAQQLDEPTSIFIQQWERPMAQRNLEPESRPCPS